MEMDWAKLGRLATTAILCLSPVVVWFEFRNKYLNYINLLKSNSFDTLENIRVELKDMKIWTGREGYYPNFHDNTWYIPRWKVKSFPFGNIRKYIWTIAHTKKYEEFNRALDKLGKAIENFESLLDHRKSILTCYSDEQLYGLQIKVNMFLSQLRLMKINQKSYSKYDKDFDLLKEEFATIRRIALLGDNDISFLNELYLANKAIHVEGIGNISSESSLYSTRNKAAEELETAFKRIPKLRASKWSFIGTLLAIIFGLIGLMYLGIFLFELSGLPGLISAITLSFVVISGRLVWDQQIVQRKIKILRKKSQP